MKYTFIAILLVIGFSMNAQSLKTAADFAASQADIKDTKIPSSKTYEEAYVVNNKYTAVDVNNLRTVLAKKGYRAAFLMKNWRFEGDLKQIEFFAYGPNKEEVCRCKTDDLDKMVILYEGNDELSCYVKEK